jgi:hypothetical protein
MPSAQIAPARVAVDALDNGDDVVGSSGNL